MVVPLAQVPGGRLRVAYVGVLLAAGCLGSCRPALTINWNGIADGAAQQALVRSSIALHIRGSCCTRGAAQCCCKHA